MLALAEAAEPLLRVAAPAAAAEVLPGTAAFVLNLLRTAPGDYPHKQGPFLLGQPLGFVLSFMQRNPWSTYQGLSGLVGQKGVISSLRRMACNAVV
jgi:hypothetical protein